MKIILDAMGGDNAPLEIVKGGLAGGRRWGVDIVFTGDESAIREALCACGHGEVPAGVEIAATSQTVDMCDDPATVFRRKKDTSMGVGLTMLREGGGDAFVSAGSTGSAAHRRHPHYQAHPRHPSGGHGTGDPHHHGAGGAHRLRRQRRVYAGVSGAVCLSGQISTHGRCWGLKSPRVGLLNIGAEDSKGTDLQKQTLARLREAAAAGHMNFIGNIEAKEAIKGGCDVIVTDGFSGNILLKSMEGVGSFAGTALKKMFKKNLLTKLAALAVMSGLNEFKGRLDPNKVGGTAFIGISKPVIKAHGSSNAEAIENAVGQAAAFARSGLIEKIEENIDLMKIEQ